MATQSNSSGGIKGAFKSFFLVLMFFALLVGSFYAGHFLYPKKVVTEKTITDTLIIRDTIRMPEPKPKIVYLARVDTVLMKEISIDTVWVKVEVPIERKIYQTSEYRAEIEGFRPSLVNMEVYPITKIITEYKDRETKITKRWGVGVQLGYGAMFYNNTVRMAPYVGVGVSHNLWSF